MKVRFQLTRRHIAVMVGCYWSGFRKWDPLRRRGRERPSGRPTGARGKPVLWSKRFPLRVRAGQEGCDRHWKLEFALGPHWFPGTELVKSCIGSAICEDVLVGMCNGGLERFLRIHGRNWRELWRDESWLMDGMSVDRYGKFACFQCWRPHPSLEGRCHTLCFQSAGFSPADSVAPWKINCHSP